MKLNNKGFTLIEGLLIVIAVTLILGVGFYVYTNNKDDNTKNLSTALDKKTTNTNTKEYIQIPGLKVKILKDTQSSRLNFSEQNTGEYTYTSVNTDQLVAAYTKCIDSSRSQWTSPTADELIRDAKKFGASMKYGQGNFQEEVGKYAASSDELVKQFADFYISINKPIGCQTEIKEIQDSFENAYKELSEIVNNSFKSADKL